MRTEQVLFWTAVAFYGLSAFSYIMGFIAKSERLFVVGLVGAAVGFLPHTASIGVRWVQGGTSPFITIAESITLGVWVSVLLYVIVELSAKRVRALGVLVVPVAFVLIGWAGTLRTGISTAQLAPALQSGWLWVHIVGATTGFSAVLVAAGLGLMYLLRQDKQGGIYDRMPDPKALDDLSYRFVVGGFTLYGVMIVSGAFWANQAKGTFWNWDPVEVWSLISWLIYGIYLHLRITMGWRGQRLAIYSLVAVAAMIVSYWGIPFGMETFHSGFRIEH
ncbi:cytochrome c biogenesis protein CcsA [Anaeromyxobacter oryzae]|uniref:C-type cytochrome biogenesis protein CcsB n=1 Tax=Anaeromyxobacter oryzae TaxID=2918170 RepID=A0ABM7X503_9BACT|nr:cytochrome c biogenesis protein CcsA [Anaeromyxobacter oryzae]BDG06856.1 c-type cytochrome biogenesis protein CcsB [Anaeromyxobacter oryzae]